MIYGTILPPNQDKRRKIRSVLEFNNKRKVYLNNKERIEFEVWVSDKVKRVTEATE